MPGTDQSFFAGTVKLTSCQNIRFWPLARLTARPRSGKRLLTSPELPTLFPGIQVMCCYFLTKYESNNITATLKFCTFESKFEKAKIET